MGKGEIACYEQFLLFPQCFQKACFPGASKGVIVWNGLKDNPQIWWPWWRRLFETWWKGRKSFSHNVFLDIKDRSHHVWYIQFVVCRYFHYWLVYTFVRDKELKESDTHDREENIVGKGQITHVTSILCFFPPCFQKQSVSGSLKVEIVW